MKLYDFPFSPNCRKVRAVAYELGIPLEYVHVDLFAGAQHRPEILAKNPNGRVPILEDGDLVLWESTAIIRYLAHGSFLVPSSRREAAEMDRWISWQLAHLGPALRTVAFETIVKRARGIAPDEARIAEGRAQVEALTAVLDGALGDREWLAGPLSLADFALGAHYSLAPACGFDLSRTPRVNAWLPRIGARPSMARALADAGKVS